MRAKFQRRHYETFATLIAEIRSRNDLFSSTVATELISALAQVFAEDNPRFNPERFITACNVRTETVRRER